ncbi:hypothetical protein [Chryseobacterium sp. MYb328]|uniref:hypothetical protein n=1 Tax=Chryseobacterium sp. MYb328 TaxID=2745231 RepID=UPI0030A6977B
METKIATNIETDTFYSIISLLKTDHWHMDIEYDHRLIDKGIDFDFYQFSKDEEHLLLAWNNWTEGEIKGTEKTISEIARQLNFICYFGEPEYLHRQDFVEEIENTLTFIK